MIPHGVLWEGESPLDGAPIVAISTWPKSRNAANVKTGVMAQVYILRRDVAPLNAIASGKDVSICGHCPMRSKEGMKGRGCYVNVGQGATLVYNAYKAGKYRYLYTSSYEDWYGMWRGRGVRWGAYGDPAMIPYEVVFSTNFHAAYHLGYTHQWQLPFAKWCKGVFMASVETQKQEEKARSLGWATFRAGLRDGSDVGSATVCANERDNTSCADCRACDGRSESIYIPSHGWGAKNVPAERLVRRKS